MISIIRFRHGKFDFEGKVIGNENYFKRLSNVDRKRWLAEEIYFRNNYGYQTMSDNTF